MIYNIITKYPVVFWNYKYHSLNPEVRPEEILKLFKEAVNGLLEEDPPPLFIKRRAFSFSRTVDADLADKIVSVWGNCDFQIPTDPTEEDLIEGVFSFGTQVPPLHYPRVAELLKTKSKELYLLFFNNRFEGEEIWLIPYFSRSHAIEFLYERQMELNEKGISTLADWLSYLVARGKINIFLTVLRPIFRNCALLEALSLKNGKRLLPFLEPLLELNRGKSDEAYMRAHQTFHPSVWPHLEPLGFSIEILLTVPLYEPIRSYKVRYLQSLAHLHPSEVLPEVLTNSLKSFVYLDGIDPFTYLFFPTNNALCRGLLKLALTPYFDWMRPLLITHLKAIAPLPASLKAAVSDFITVAAEREEDIREISERHGLSETLFYRLPQMRLDLIHANGYLHKIVSKRVEELFRQRELDPLFLSPHLSFYLLVAASTLRRLKERDFFQTVRLHLLKLDPEAKLLIGFLELQAGLPLEAYMKNALQLPSTSWKAAFQLADPVNWLSLLAKSSHRYRLLRELLHPSRMGLTGEEAIRLLQQINSPIDEELVAHWIGCNELDALSAVEDLSLIRFDSLLELNPLPIHLIARLHKEPLSHPSPLSYLLDRFVRSAADKDIDECKSLAESIRVLLPFYKDLDRRELFKKTLDSLSLLSNYLFSYYILLLDAGFSLTDRLDEEVTFCDYLAQIDHPSERLVPGLAERLLQETDLSIHFLDRFNTINEPTLFLLLTSTSHREHLLSRFSSLPQFVQSFVFLHILYVLSPEQFLDWLVQQHEPWLFHIGPHPLFSNCSFESIGAEKGASLYERFLQMTQTVNGEVQNPFVWLDIHLESTRMLRHATNLSTLYPKSHEMRRLAHLFSEKFRVNYFEIAERAIPFLREMLLNLPSERTALQELMQKCRQLITLYESIRKRRRDEEGTIETFFSLLRQLEKSSLLQFEKVGRSENSSTRFEDQEIFGYLSSLLQDATLKSCKEILGCELREFYDLEITTCADLMPYGIDDSLSSSTEETFPELLKASSAHLDDDKKEKFSSYTFADRHKVERELHILLIRKAMEKRRLLSLAPDENSPDGQ